jgi:LemA protein
MQRRADLIPNLVETVKGVAKQEQKVFGDIAAARSAMLAPGPLRKKCRPTPRSMARSAGFW